MGVLCALVMCPGLPLMLCGSGADLAQKKNRQRIGCGSSGFLVFGLVKWQFLRRDRFRWCFLCFPGFASSPDGFGLFRCHVV